MILISNDMQGYDVNCLESAIADIVEKDGKNYIVKKGEELNDISEYHIINITAYSHYLYILKDWVTEGFIEFKNEKLEDAYLHKIEVLIKMINNNNYNGTLKKGLNDVYKHTHEWITNKNQIEVIDTILYFTNWMIENQEFLYEPPNMVNVYKWHYKDAKTGKYCCESVVYFLGITVWHKKSCVDYGTWAQNENWCW